MCTSRDVWDKIGEAEQNKLSQIYLISKCSILNDYATLTIKY